MIHNAYCLFQRKSCRVHTFARSSIFAALCLLLLAGCARDNMREELMRYATQFFPECRRMEADVMKQYRAVSGENFQDEATLYETLKQRVIPAYKAVIQHAAMAAPATYETRHMHEAYMGMLRTRLEGFELLVQTMELQDEGSVRKTMALLDSIDVGLQSFDPKLAELCAQRNIVLPKTENAP